MSGDEGNGPSQAHTRRSFLKLAGLTATAVGVGGVAWHLEGGGSDHRTVNLLDRGVDSTGGEPIDAALSAVAGDDTTVRLPAGTYRLGSFSSRSLSNFTLEGDGATLVPPQGSTNVMLDLHGNDITLRGFTFDYSAGNTAAQVVVRCADGLLVENCEFVGVADVYGGEGRSAHEYHLMPAVVHPDGEGVVRNVTMADGTISPSNRGGVWVGDTSGRLRFENVHLERWANNSLYVQESKGTLEVHDSRFVNNNVGGPRIGAKNAEVTNTSVVSDGWVPVQGFTGERQSRGLWIDDNCESVRVDGCEFVMTGPHASDAIVFQNWSTASNAGFVPAAVKRLTGGTSIDVSDSRFVVGPQRQAVSHRSDGATVTTENLDVRVA